MHTIAMHGDDGWCVYFTQDGIKMNGSIIKDFLSFDEAAELCSYLNGGLPSAKRMLEILEELERASRSVTTV